MKPMLNVMDGSELHSMNRPKDENLSSQVLPNFLSITNEYSFHSLCLLQ